MKTITFDCETTGCPKKGQHYEKNFMDFPRIVSLAWKVNDDPAVEYIINQEGFEIPQEVIDIHGITNEIAEASEHKIATVLERFFEEANDVNYLIGHNIYFDSSMIKSNFLRCLQNKPISNLDFEAVNDILHKSKRICTMRYGSKITGKWPKLIDLHKALLGYDFDAHHAKDDVEACYRCYQELVKRGVITI